MSTTGYSPEPRMLRSKPAVLLLCLVCERPVRALASCCSSSSSASSVLVLACSGGAALLNGLHHHADAIHALHPLEQEGKLGNQEQAAAVQLQLRRTSLPGQA